jgi:hypothetical protein
MGRHVACVGEIRNATKFWSENLNREDQLGDKGINGSIILDRAKIRPIFICHS